MYFQKLSTFVLSLVHRTVTMETNGKQTELRESDHLQTWRQKHELTMYVRPDVDSATAECNGDPVRSDVQKETH